MDFSDILNRVLDFQIDLYQSLFIVLIKPHICEHQVLDPRRNQGALGDPVIADDYQVDVVFDGAVLAARDQVLGLCADEHDQE